MAGGESYRCGDSSTCLNASERALNYLSFGFSVELDELVPSMRAKEKLGAVRVPPDARADLSILQGAHDLFYLNACMQCR